MDIFMDIYDKFIPDRVRFQHLPRFLSPIGYNLSMNEIANFIRKKRKQAKLTQKELSERAGVGLRFIRELENDKPTLRLDKVDQILKLFGHTVGPVPIKRKID